MNWYRLAQQIETYMDIGHPEYDVDLDKEKTFALWTSDLAGGNFQVERIPVDSQITHYDLFGKIDAKKKYQGRYDPFKNITSIVTPVSSSLGRISVSTDEIPNRLIGKLMKEFPGTKIYAFPYFESHNRGSWVEII